MNSEKFFFEGHPAVFVTLGQVLLSFLTLGIMALVYFVRSRAVHYRLSNQRVVVENGLLSKRMEQMELARITDFVVEVPLGQKLVGTGNLVLHAIDRSTPLLRIEGLKTDVRQLYEQLRAAAEQQRAQHNVRVVDYE